MDHVLQVFPSAQQALETYHINRLAGSGGGGFQPDDSLATVALNHGVDVTEVIEHIKRSQDLVRDLEITVHEAAAMIAQEQVALLDVRAPQAFAMASIPGSRLLDDATAQDIVARWPRETFIVLVCHHGERSLHAAAYLRDHGFTQARSLSGGVDAWSLEIDPSVPRY